MAEQPKSNGTVDVGGLWTILLRRRRRMHCKAARFVVDLPKKRRGNGYCGAGMN